MHWVAVGALALAAAGFAGLGRWQLDRADVNRAIVEQFAATASLAPIEQPVADAEAFRYRPMRLHGRYVPESQVLLDNMTSRGVAGYQVLTPLRIPGDRLVLVNRGWLPASPDRSVLPDVAIEATADVVVTGRIDHLPRAALDLGQSAIEHGAPVTALSFPDFAVIEAALGKQVHPFQLLLDPAAPEGYVRDWAPPADRADRNIAYAVQWFGLAVLAVVLAIGVALRRFRRATEAVT
jgi:surfeit locus 1 family protein